MSTLQLTVQCRAHLHATTVRPDNGREQRRLACTILEMLTLPPCKLWHLKDLASRFSVLIP